LLIGALVTRIGYTPFFIALGVFDLVAAAILWTLVVKPGAAPARESGIIPVLLGGATAAYLGGIAGIGSAGIAGYVGFGFGLLLLALGLAIEIRLRIRKTA